MMPLRAALVGVWLLILLRMSKAGWQVKCDEARELQTDENMGVGWLRKTQVFATKMLWFHGHLAFQLSSRANWVKLCNVCKRMTDLKIYRSGHVGSFQTFRGSAFLVPRSGSSTMALYHHRAVQVPLVQ
jgi:hypothetical protein